MWKLLLTAAIIMNVGEAQRSSYAARPGTNTKLLPRFRKNNTDSGLGTRGGQEDSDSGSTTTLAPEGTLEDQRFVHRVSKWPEDRQPFWFKNRYAISSMRDRDIDGGNAYNQRPQFQSSFQGQSSRGKSFAQFAPNDAFYDFLNDPFPLNFRRPYYG